MARSKKKLKKMTVFGRKHSIDFSSFLYVLVLRK